MDAARIAQTRVQRNGLVRSFGLLAGVAPLLFWTGQGLPPQRLQPLTMLIAAVLSALLVARGALSNGWRRTPAGNAGALVAAADIAGTVCLIVLFGLAALIVTGALAGFHLPDTGFRGMQWPDGLDARTLRHGKSFWTGRWARSPYSR